MLEVRHPDKRVKKGLTTGKELGTKKFKKESSRIGQTRKGGPAEGGNESEISSHQKERDEERVGQSINLSLQHSRNRTVESRW